MRTIECLQFECFEAPNSFRSFSGYFHALVMEKRENSNDTSSLSITFKMSSSKQLWPIAVCDRSHQKMVRTVCQKSTNIVAASVNPPNMHFTARENIHESYGLSLRKPKKAKFESISFDCLHMHEGARAHDHDYAVFILVSILSLCFYRVGSLRIDLVSISFSA